MLRRRFLSLAQAVSATIGLAIVGIGLVSAQQQLPVTLVSITSPVAHGHVASISVKTVPGAVCAITVIYKSGPSRAKGLTQKAADNTGAVAWSWIVGTRTTPGTWPVFVTCSSGGKTGKLKTSFEVQ
jgi:hypothetical protein